MRRFSCRLFALGIALYVCTVASTKVHGEDAEARVDALLGQMTLDEKLSLLGGDRGDFSTVPVPRLNIPKLVMADGPQGVRNYAPSCQFPCGAALAATWDASLAEAYGRALGLEARARGVHIMLGPGVNIVRLPVNGRCFEYFGEDPFLASNVAARYIEGMQAEGVAATIKHFAANNQETHRFGGDVDMDDRTLHEIYLPTFRRAVSQAHVWAAMSAYNRFRGEYCTHSDFLQNTILKGELRFPGLLMSDWGACHETTDLARGLDLEMGHANFFRPEKIREALDRHEIDPARVDDAVRRLLRLMVGMGFLDHEQKRPELPLDSPASAQTALEVARGAVVLLKNQDNCLPLDRKQIHRLAVYGPNAAQTPGGAGGSGSVTPFRAVTFLEGIRAKAGPGVEVISVPEVEATQDLAEHFPMVRTALDGPPGFHLTASMHRPEGKQDLPPQTGVNLNWKSGELPFGMAGESADYQFSGVLVPDEDGEWEVFSDGHLSIDVEGLSKTLKKGDVLHVEKGKTLPVRVSYRNVRRTDTQHEQKTYANWLALRRPQLPDLAAARNADAAIVCVGFRASSESEGYDRSFDLPEMQRRLIAAVSAANPHTVVTNNSGAGIGLAQWIDEVPAVLQTWYLGQEGGTALGEILFGDVNPSGRLPDTFDRTFADNPAAANYPGVEEDPAKKWPAEHYKEGIFVGYRGYDKAQKAPLFPFGFGLSYTNFEFSDLRVAKTGEGMAQVTLKVKNTGQRAGAEVVQVYLGQPQCPVERPVRELKAFAKVALQPGEARDVTLELPRESFAFWHPLKREWTVDPASFVIEAGHSSRELPLRTDFDLGSH